jgi:hypothetical protein
MNFGRVSPRHAVPDSSILWASVRTKSSKWLNVDFFTEGVDFRLS